MSRQISACDSFFPLIDVGSYYTYYQNLIKNKSAHSKISNAFWSIPGISHKERDSDYIPVWHDLQSITCCPFQAVQQP